MSAVRDHGRRQVRDAEQAGEHLATFRHGGGKCYAVSDDEGLHIFRREKGDREDEDETMGDHGPDLGEAELLPRDRKLRGGKARDGTIGDNEQVDHRARLRRANERNAAFWAKQGA